MSAFPDTPVKLLRKLSAQPPAPEQESDWVLFVEMYEPVIRAFVAAEDLQPADVDDTVQNVFVRLLGIMRRDGYDRSRGRFRTYLRTIMRRVLIDFFRRQTAERVTLHTPFNEDETQADEGLVQGMERGGHHFKLADVHRYRHLSRRGAGLIAARRNPQKDRGSRCIP